MCSSQQTKDYTPYFNNLKNHHTERTITHCYGHYQLASSPLWQCRQRETQAKFDKTTSSCTELPSNLKSLRMQRHQQRAPKHRRDKTPPMRRFWKLDKFWINWNMRLFKAVFCLTRRLSTAKLDIVPISFATGTYLLGRTRSQVFCDGEKLKVKWWVILEWFAIELVLMSIICLQYS